MKILLHALIAFFPDILIIDIAPLPIPVEIEQYYEKLSTLGNKPNYYNHFNYVTINKFYSKYKFQGGHIFSIVDQSIVGYTGNTDVQNTFTTESKNALSEAFETHIDKDIWGDDLNSRYLKGLEDSGLWWDDVEKQSLLIVSKELKSIMEKVNKPLREKELEIEEFLEEFEYEDAEDLEILEREYLEILQRARILQYKILDDTEILPKQNYIGENIEVNKLADDPERSFEAQSAIDWITTYVNSVIPSEKNSLSHLDRKSKEHFDGLINMLEKIISNDWDRNNISERFWYGNPPYPDPWDAPKGYYPPEYLFESYKNTKNLHFNEQFSNFEETFNNQDFESALRLINDLISEGGSNYLYHNRAKVYFYLKKYSKSIEDCNRVVESLSKSKDQEDPIYFILLLDRAKSLFFENKVNQFIKDIRTVIKNYEAMDETLEEQKKFYISRIYNNLGEIIQIKIEENINTIKNNLGNKKNILITLGLENIWEGLVSQFIEFNEIENWIKNELRSNNSK